jgi:hypothetical protein
VRILATALWLTILLPFAVGGQTSVIHSATFVSPDKRFAFKVSDEDFSGNDFDLQDLKSGKWLSAADSDYLDLPTPVFFVGWTGDSKSILVIGHSDSGSIATAVHFDGAGWRKIDIQPSLKLPMNAFYFVLHQHVGLHTINLTYGIDAPTANGRDSYVKTSFEFDPATGRYGDVNKVPADYGVYRERE